ncbi:hypothetical protein PSEUDO9AG_40048 [Pseudomonas sp. 9Ag]|nr:hypothetical protein PSEUDO9AG_40048 [Pseudomonas sp. 9Ag]
MLTPMPMPDAFHRTRSHSARQLCHEARDQRQHAIAGLVLRKVATIVEQYRLAVAANLTCDGLQLCGCGELVVTALNGEQWHLDARQGLMQVPFGKCRVQPGFTPAAKGTVKVFTVIGAQPFAKVATGIGVDGAAHTFDAGLLDIDVRREDNHTTHTRIPAGGVGQRNRRAVAVTEQHHLTERQAVQHAPKLIGAGHAEVIERTWQPNRAGAAITLPAINQHRRAAVFSQLRWEVLPQLEAAEPFMQQDERRTGRTLGLQQLILEPGTGDFDEFSVRHGVRGLLFTGPKINRSARRVWRRRPSWEL